MRIMTALFGKNKRMMGGFVLWKNVSKDKKINAIYFKWKSNFIGDTFLILYIIMEPRSKCGVVKKQTKYEQFKWMIDWLINWLNDTCGADKSKPHCKWKMWNSQRRKWTCFYFSTPTADGHSKKVSKRYHRNEVEMLGQIDETKLGTRNHTARK